MLKKLIDERNVVNFEINALEGDSMLRDNNRLHKTLTAKLRQFYNLTKEIEKLTRK